ncbi:MAG: FHA domain-containing protein [Coriobacteriia bacterium]
MDAQTLCRVFDESRCRGRVLLLLTTLLWVLAAPVCFANDGILGGAGGSVTFIPSSNVRMESELVQVTILRDYAVYQVNFHFVNSGAPQRVKLGFPFPKIGEEDGTTAAAFQAWQDGAALPVKKQDGWDLGNPVTFFTHDVTFPTGKSTVTVLYLAKPGWWTTTSELEPPARLAGSKGYEANYPYTVHSGAGWKDTIHQTVLRFTVTPEFNGWGIDQRIADTTTEDEVFTKAYVANLKSVKKPKPGVYEWTFTDFEPDEDHDIALPYLIPGLIDGKEPKPVTASGDTQDGSGQWVSNGDPSSGWMVSNASAGRGAWVRIPFDSDRAVRQIRVVPGEATSPEAFYANSRPKRLAVEFSDGTKTEITLKDVPSLQLFSVNANAQWAKVTVLESYAGTKSPHNLYLAEVEFATDPLAQEVIDPFQTAVAASTPVAAGESSSTASSAVSTPSTASTGSDSGSSSGLAVRLGLAGLVLAAAVAALLLVRARTASQSGESTPDADLADAGGAPRAWLLSPTGERYLLDEGATTIGSGAENAIVLEGSDVAVCHAAITASPAGWSVKAVSHTATTKVNGVVVGDATQIAPGDVLDLGGVELTLQAE